MRELRNFMSVYFKILRIGVALLVVAPLACGPMRAAQQLVLVSDQTQIIKHNSEWISAYAHNDRRLVAEGVKVKAGQHIADMGRTGAVRDMLHFEIRRNGKPVDPLLYLPKP